MRSKRRLVGFARGLFALMVMLAANASTVTSSKAATLNVVSCDANELISTIATATSDSAPDTVSLAPGCTYTLTTGGFSADGQNGLPDITSPMTINGNGATIARDSAGGTPSFRILHVASSGTLLLNTVTISNGIELRGGGIYSTGTLTITYSTLTHNQALRDYGDYGYGGGIYVAGGSTTLNDSSLTSNQANGGYRGFGWGGGIYVAGGAVTISNSALTGNHATALYGDYGYGGAIAVGGGAVVISSSTISDNQAFGNFGGSGGGIYLDGGTTTISNSTLSSNRAIGRDGPMTAGFGAGGAVYLNSGTLAMTASILRENRATGSHGGTGEPGGTGYGGGMFVKDGTAAIVATVFAGNQAIGGLGGADLGGAGVNAGGYGGGGGIYTEGGTVTLSTSTLISNQAIGGAGGSEGGTGGTAYGGGAAFMHGTAMIMNSTLSGSQAIGGAGGASVNYGGGNGGFGWGGAVSISTNVGLSATSVVTVTNGTITQNHAEGGMGGSGGGSAGVTGSGIGGGMRRHDGSAAIGNTLIAHNTVSGGASTQIDVSGAFTSQGYNLIGDTTGGSGFSGPGDQVGASANPIDPLLGPLADNGGPTQTHALLTGSPAIDAGNPAPAGSNGDACPATDQRGLGRVGRCDIGAFEFGAILRKNTATTLISSKNLAHVGQIVTFTATTVALSPGAGTPTGSVTFYDGATALGSSALDSSGRAALSTDGLAAGSHTISAVYSGDASYAPSSSTDLTQLVIAREIFMPLLQR